MDGNISAHGAQLSALPAQATTREGRQECHSPWAEIVLSVEMLQATVWY